MKSGLQKLVHVCFAIIVASCQPKTDQKQKFSPHPAQILSGPDTVLSAERDTFSILKNKSRDENKKIFMVFSFHACSLCRIFEKYHNDPVVKQILNKYYIFSEVDINKVKGGKELYSIYGKRGFPSWTILDVNGNLIIDSDDTGTGTGNIGYPSSAGDIHYYIAALKKATPAIQNSECEMLKYKLKEYRYGNKDSLVHKSQ
jgi:thioredoxin-related protein